MLVGTRLGEWDPWPCPEGTARSYDRGPCEVVCGAGTHRDGDRCVADQVANPCPERYYLDPATGRCTPAYGPWPDETGGGGAGGGGQTDVTPPNPPPPDPPFPWKTVAIAAGAIIVGGVVVGMLLPRRGGGDWQSRYPRRVPRGQW